MSVITHPVAEQVYKREILSCHCFSRRAWTPRLQDHSTIAHLPIQLFSQTDFVGYNIKSFNTHVANKIYIAYQ